MLADSFIGYLTLAIKNWTHFNLICLWRLHLITDICTLPSMHEHRILQSKQLKLVMQLQSRTVSSHEIWTQASQEILDSASRDYHSIKATRKKFAQFVKTTKKCWKLRKQWKYANIAIGLMSFFFLLNIGIYELGLSRRRKKRETFQRRRLEGMRTRQKEEELNAQSLSAMEVC